MVALWDRADHYILPCGFLFLLSFFPRLISQRSLIGCSPYFHTWCCLSANLGCRSQTCCTRLSENAGCKKRHLRTIVQLCRAISSQLRHVSTIGKKLLSSNISSRCPLNMVNFGVLAAEIGPVVWGTPANFNGFRVFGSVTARQSSSGRQPNCGVEQRAPSRWALAHILVCCGSTGVLVGVHTYMV